MDVMASRSRTVGGVPTSLIDLGFSDAGIDDCWQKCGSYGPNNYTYHDSTGAPVVDTERFPSLKGMTDYAHALGLSAGWYGAPCRGKRSAVLLLPLPCHREHHQSFPDCPR